MHPAFRSKNLLLKGKKNTLNSGQNVITAELKTRLICFKIIENTALFFKKSIALPVLRYFFKKYRRYRYYKFKSIVTSDIQLKKLWTSQICL